MIVDGDRSSLMNATLKSKNYAWCLLMAAMLFDLGTIVQAFRECQKDTDGVALFSGFKETLNSCGRWVHWPGRVFLMIWIAWNIRISWSQWRRC